jgi:hypothetical protein
VYLPSNRATGSPARAGERLAAYSIRRPRARIMGFSVGILVEEPGTLRRRIAETGAPGYERRIGRNPRALGEVPPAIRTAVVLESERR